MQFVKAINDGQTDQWHLDVLGVPFGGPYGGKDAQGEYFTPASDLWLERIPKRPVVYYHGLAEQGAAEVIGEETGWEKRGDGIWFRVALDRSKALARRVWEAAQKGVARASSGAISHLVRVADDGRILVWPIGEISLLDAREHAPANPYAVALIHAKATFEKAGLGGVEAFADSPTQGDHNRCEASVSPLRKRGEGGAKTPRAAGQVRSPINPLGWRPPEVTPAAIPSTVIEQRGQRAGAQSIGAREVRRVAMKEKLVMTLDEMTIRNILRQEINTAFEDAVATAVSDTVGDTGPNAMFMTRTGPALISQRGEPPLTANGTPFVDAIKAMRQGRFEVVRFQLAGKSLSEGSDSAGGYLVPTEHSNRLIERLAARTAVRAAGATVIPMSSDILQIPAQTGGATAYWVAENAQIMASDQTWGQVQLQAKKLAALTKLSAELFEDSDPQVEALVMSDLARVLALEEDLKYLRGTGASNTPIGLDNHADVDVDDTTMGANGGAPTFDILANLLYALDAANVPLDGRAWVVHPRTVNTLRKVKDSQNHYLWADPAAPGDPPTLWGYPVFTSTAIPINETQGTSNDASTIYLGAWPEFVIGQRKALELRASDAAGNAFEYDQVFIRAIMRVDCNVRHGASFKVLKGVRA
jgi:HK97 family phage major capsid protein